MAYSKVNWADGSTPVNATNLGKMDQGIADVDAAQIPKALVDAKGDLVVGFANDDARRLAVGPDGQVLLADAASTLGMKWASVELAYAQLTGLVNVTATTEATADVVVTAPAITCDGVSPILITFYSEGIRAALVANASITIWLFENGASIGAIAVTSTPAAAQLFVPCTALRRRVPAAGSRTYSIRASVSTGSGSVLGGTGAGPGADAPAFIRITRAV